MNSSQLLGFTTFAYLISSFLYIGIFVFRAKKLGLAASLTVLLGFLLNTAGIALRWIESYKIGAGHAPLSNMYESLVFFAWCIAIFYIFLEIKFKNKLIGAFAVPFAFLSMALASLTSSEILATNLSETKSLMKRFGATKVSDPPSVLACSGLIQVLNCCDGNSSCNRSMHCCHTASGKTYPSSPKDGAGSHLKIMKVEFLFPGCFRPPGRRIIPSKTGLIHTCMKKNSGDHSFKNQ